MVESVKIHQLKKPKSKVLIKHHFVQFISDREVGPESTFVNAEPRKHSVDV